ncbi:uncharacterized protein ARMOST_02715 [Armillaria ostoyae]|uniref:Uncharacterized protein n=1 Tax=Armillaria ostoyae TaxID=47428 RepID=A0A284QSH2_ARMOS|nr:uncharacterized protein ARMOST_02715 [Armillaria ostoyae]
MSAFDHFGRSRAQGPILNDGTYPSYGAIEAALEGHVHNIEAHHRLVNHSIIRKAQGIEILAKVIGLLLAIPFALICVAIIVAIISAVSGAWLVVGHWILLHLSSPQSPYSQVSFWSTFLVGFWGSMAAFLPFGVLSISLQACFLRASDGAFRILSSVLSILWVGIYCVAGVPLVGHYYGIETLGLEYAVCAAYTAWAAGFFVFIVTVPCMLV